MENLKEFKNQTFENITFLEPLVHVEIENCNFTNCTFTKPLECISCLDTTFENSTFLSIQYCDFRNSIITQCTIEKEFEENLFSECSLVDIPTSEHYTGTTIHDSFVTIDGAKKHVEIFTYGSMDSLKDKYFANSNNQIETTPKKPITYSDFENISFSDFENISFSEPTPKKPLNDLLQKAGEKIKVFEDLNNNDIDDRAEKENFTLAHDPTKAEKNIADERKEIER